MDPSDERELERFIANTIAVLTHASEHLPAWRTDLQTAMATAQKAGADEHAAFFQGLVALLDGQQPQLGSGHLYGAAIRAVVQGVEAAQQGAGASQTLPAEQLDAIVRNTLAVLTVAPSQLESWRAQVQAAIDDARPRGPAWQAELELFEQVLATLGGSRPSLPAGHVYEAQAAQIVAGLEEAATSRQGQAPADRALSADQVLAIVANSVAVMTSEREQIPTWRRQLEQARRKAQDQGLTSDAQFLTAVVDLLAGKTPSLPRENPYRSALQQIEASLFAPPQEGEEAKGKGYTIAVPTLVVEAVQAFVDASNWAEARQVMEQRALALLRPEAETLLAGMAAQAQQAGRVQASSRLAERLAVLSACKSAGIEATFGRLSGDG